MAIPTKFNLNLVILRLQDIVIVLCMWNKVEFRLINQDCSEAGML